MKNKDWKKVSDGIPNIHEVVLGFRNGTPDEELCWYIFTCSHNGAYFVDDEWEEVNVEYWMDVSISG